MTADGRNKNNTCFHCYGKKLELEFCLGQKILLQKAVVTYVVTWSQIKFRYDLMKMVEINIKIQ